MRRRRELDCPTGVASSGRRQLPIWRSSRRTNASAAPCGVDTSSSGDVDVLRPSSADRLAVMMVVAALSSGMVLLGAGGGEKFLVRAREIFQPAPVMYIGPSVGVVGGPSFVYLFSPHHR